MAIYYPPIFINNYLAEKHSEYFDNVMPFFPTMPTDIDSLTEFYPEGLFCVYDRMFRLSRRTFPHIRSEQILYYFYKNGDDQMKILAERTQLVQDLFDNGDESAQDLNDWIRGQINGGVVTFGTEEFLPVYFHNMKVYQLEEVRDIVDFGTARTWAGNKIIIDYDWHKGE